MSDRTFEFLLNAVVHAAQTSNPSEHGYTAKRKAVFDYVRQLETDLREARELYEANHG